MKIIIFSDTHGAFAPLQQIVRMHEDADAFIHLGDGERETAHLMSTLPWFAQKLHYLKGNCDTGMVIPDTCRKLALTLPFGHRLFAAHGDYYQVKFGTARLAWEARQEHADIALYGHTHVSDCRYEDGLYIINPGSLGCPRDGKPPGYCLLHVTEKGVLPNIAYL